MKRLYLYYLKQFCTYFVLTATLFLVLYVAIDFIYNFRSYGDTFAEAFSNYILKIPTLVYQVQALGLFAANMMVLSSLHAKREGVVLATSGIHLGRVVMPVLALTLLISVGLAVVYDWVYPSLYQVQQTRTVFAEKGRKYKFGIFNAQVWYRFPNTLYRIGAVYPDKSAMDSVTIYEFDAHFRLSRWVKAKFASLQDTWWTLEEGQLVDLQKVVPKVVPFKVLRMERAEQMGDFHKLRSDPQLLHADQLVRGLMESRFRDGESHRYLTSLLERCVYVFLPFLLLGVGVNFVRQRSRQTSFLVNVGMVFLVSIGFWTLHHFMLVLGYAGKLSPWVAALASPLGVLVVGTGLWKIRK
jgi:LPS export ABC transporter permease LptG